MQKKFQKKDLIFFETFEKVPAFEKVLKKVPLKKVPLKKVPLKKVPLKKVPLIEKVLTKIKKKQRFNFFIFNLKKNKLLKLKIKKLKRVLKFKAFFIKIKNKFNFLFFNFNKLKIKKLRIIFLLAIFFVILMIED